MRKLIIATAFIAAGAAQAEPKHTAKEPGKQIAAKETEVVVPAFQPRAIEAKPIEIATPDLEIKTKDVASSALDRKINTRTAKVAQGSEANLMRAPAKPAVIEAAEAAEAAETQTATGKP